MYIILCITPASFCLLGSFVAHTYFVIGLRNKTSADNVPALIAPNENITFQEINNRLVCKGFAVLIIEFCYTAKEISGCSGND